MKYIYAVIVLMFLALGFGYYQRGNQITRLESDNLRLSQNQSQLLDDNLEVTNLNLKQKEFIKLITDSLKLTLHKLNIKPKTVTKIEERIVTHHDTIIKEVPVSPLKKDTWLIHDQDKCYLWEGIAHLLNDSLNVRKINFSYLSKTTDIFHKVPKRKLFGLIPIGKKIIQTTKSDCGQTVTREITITK